MATILFILFSIFLQGVIGELVCEELPIGTCSFAISSFGKRCVLETYTSNYNEKNVAYMCETSNVEVNDMPEWIENDACIEACGLDRYTVGISSDSLIEPGFTDKICGPACYMNCPNIIDLYYNLAMGEGVFLPDICKSPQNNSRRALRQISSLGIVSENVSPSTELVPVSNALKARHVNNFQNPLIYAPTSYLI